MADEQPATTAPEPATAGSQPIARHSGSTASEVAPCPYLSSADRAWVASAPSRDHRCEAVAPAAALALDKQRRLCLTADHLGCATYLAALEARAERLSPAERAAPGWGWVRTTPLVDGSIGIAGTRTGLVTERRGWQAIPAVLLVVALAALGLSNLGGGGSPEATTFATLPVALGSASPTPPAPTPSLGTTPSPAATASGTPGPSPTPSPGPTGSAAPATPTPSLRTYTVKSGDTLYGIAITFKTTVAAIRRANNLSGNNLHVGQVLRIP